MGLKKNQIGETEFITLIKTLTDYEIDRDPKYLQSALALLFEFQETQKKFDTTPLLNTLNPKFYFKYLFESMGVTKMSGDARVNISTFLCKLITEKEDKLIEQDAVKLVIDLAFNVMVEANRVERALNYDNFPYGAAKNVLQHLLVTLPFQSVFQTSIDYLRPQFDSTDAHKRLTVYRCLDILQSANVIELRQNESQLRIYWDTVKTKINDSNQSVSAG